MAVDETTAGGSGDDPTPSRYHVGRPGDNRRSTPWHRDRHHIDVLPARLEALSRRLPVSRDGRILDYGCAEVPYRRFFGDEVEYVAADLAGNPAATLELNEDGTVPAESATFDAVLSTQVLEHVTDPQRYLSEAYRVLRPGGEMLLSTHGIFIYHPDPVDLWRWTSAGLRHAVELEGFEVTHFEGMVGLVPTGLQLVQDGIYWNLPPRLRPLLALVMQALIKATDRLHGPESRAMNAQVFALIARKPTD
jgi:SAM-dependent methyltransferase